MIEKKMNRRLLKQIDENSLLPFYDEKVLPKSYLFKERAQEIIDEYHNNKRKDQMYLPYPARKLYSDEDWNIIPIQWKGAKLKDHLDDNKFIDVDTEFPILAKTIEEVFGEYQTAGAFSRLKANSKIKPHRGLPVNVLRFHFGIDVPPGSDIGIRVRDEKRYWKNGEIIIFDDRIEHEAWNNSNQDRVVLIIDFLYEAPGFFEERRYKNEER
jgi:aspartyl/asparaginyl beta-hydroxylase (cupin superfamily)